MREGDEAFDALRDAIEAFAVARAPELVAEARAEAAARVRSMLSDAMAHALLEQARGQLAVGGEEPPSRGAPAAPVAPTAAAAGAGRAEGPEGDPGCYVYGVARATDAVIPEELAGVDPRHVVTLVEHEGLVAVASEVSLAEFGEEELRENLNDIDWLERKARAHEHVLEEALARATVVPMRLCTIYRGEGQVRQMLSREHDALVDALNRLEGKTEWSAKLIAAPGALARAVAEEDSDTGGEQELAPGAAYMRDRGREARDREAMDRVAEDWTGAMHERLAAKAVEALVNPLQNPEVSGHAGDMLLNGAYLVANAELDAFHEEIEALQREYGPRGASVDMSGPWPPYNFVERSIETTR